MSSCAVPTSTSPHPPAQEQKLPASGPDGAPKQIVPKTGSDFESRCKICRLERSPTGSLEWGRFGVQANRQVSSSDVQSFRTSPIRSVMTCSIPS